MMDKLLIVVLFGLVCNMFCVCGCNVTVGRAITVFSLYYNILDVLIRLAHDINYSFFHFHSMMDAIFLHI